MNRLIDNMDKLFGLMPYLILSGNLPWHYVPFFLIFPIIYEKVIRYISELFFTDYTYDIYQFNEAKQVNPFYKYITFALKKHDLIKNITNVEFDDIGYNYNKKISNELHDGIFYKEVPRLNPVNSKKIQFIHNNIKIHIVPSMNIESTSVHKKHKYYRLISPNYDNIKKFMNYMNVIQREFVNKFSSKKQRQFNYFDITDKKWIEIPINVNKTFDNIFLNYEIKTKIINDIDNFVSNKKKYKLLGIPRKMGYLLYGSPGNGKSSLIYAIAKKYNKSIYKINLSVTKPDFIKQICSVLQGSVVIFEDIDVCKISHDREENDNTENKKIIDRLELSDILEILDGYCYLNECIVIMTTNHINKLDGALIRSGRMDHKINFTNASVEQIIQIIKYFCQKDIDPNIIKNINISVSELINTIIIPNLDNYEFIRNYLTEPN